MIYREKETLSLKIYRDNIVKNISNYDVKLTNYNLFNNKIFFKNYDILWDPGLGMRRIPFKFYNKLNVPKVCTIHGLRAFSLPYKELSNNVLELISILLLKKYINIEWKLMKRKINAIIAVSKFGAKEIEQSLMIPESKIFYIYHGVNNRLFKYDNQVKKRKYFLMIANFQPKKNLDRVIEAYKDISKRIKLPFKVIIPGFKNLKIFKDIKGLEITNKTLSQVELSKLYKNALAFIFPSLHETFGMPILEAMACGCPVITSNVSACPEVAGDAALLVNPYSVDEIKEAMERIIEDRQLREELSEKGIERAKQFTWEKSARKHLEVFKKVINGEI